MRSAVAGEDARHSDEDVQGRPADGDILKR
jgi:hypothetical protein